MSKDYVAIGKKISAAKMRHGLCNTKIWTTWSGMRQRCLNPNNKRWASYGGRGIKICSRWNTFEYFLCDVGMPPSERHQLDRINNDGDYEPGNVRWATPKEQANNHRSNVNLSHGGQTLTLTQWAERIGMRPQTLWARIYRNGWSVERALSEPKR